MASKAVNLYYDPDGRLPPPFTGGRALTVTKYERARLLSVRSMQLANNAPPRVEVVDHRSGAGEVATRELTEGRLPLLLRRGDQHYRVLAGGLILEPVDFK